MCELLGMSFNFPVSPNISFRGFSNRGSNNPHGWGFAFYPDESVQIYREPIPANESELSEFIQQYHEIKSKIFLIHVRLASRGNLSHRNTHPFSRELHGKEFIFAHNGTLQQNYDGLNLDRFKPVGQTDSEFVFCWLLQQIFERDIVNKWSKADFIWLNKILRTINQRGNFNCMLSDGNYLFCYFDANGYNGLHFLKREAPYNVIELLDEDYKINLNYEKDPRQKGYVIATKPLTKGEKWHSFHKGELIVFRNGEKVFSSSKNLV